MNEQQHDWKAILNSPKFIELHRKKTAFLITLWVVGALPYLLLIIGVGYAPEIFKTRILGRMNIGYLLCLFQFFMIIAIGLYYNYRTGKDFDPLTKEFLNEIQKGGAL